MIIFKIFPKDSFSKDFQKIHFQKISKRFNMGIFKRSCQKRHL